MIVDKEKIEKAKEKLGEKNAEFIISALGVEEYDQKNLKACCPFHHENTPSFIYNSKQYNWHCFGCGKTVDLIDAFMLKGKSFIEATQELFVLAKIKYSFGEHLVKTKEQYKYPYEVVCDSKTETYEYLEGRKISPSTADHLDIRQDGKGNMVFNYYDTNDVLTTVKYRPHRRMKKGENKTWVQPGSGLTYLLYNMNRVNPDQPLLITCGELDCASAIEAGFTNAVSIPMGDQNTQWISECWDFLEQFEQIIICHDNDSAGEKFCKEVIPRLGSYKCKIAQVPESYEDETGETRHIKDLNQALAIFGKEKVLEIIVNAKDSPVPSLIDFSDVEEMDLSDIDGIYTGIEGIDKAITRFYFGTMNIITGKPSSGKTSFLDQLICQAIDQDHNVWLYSKEMPAFMTKNWINFIYAGVRNVNQYENARGSVYYKVTPEAKNAISEYYRGKLYMYKDDYSNDVKSIEDSMVDAARKYGSKLFIIDNLTIVNLGANEQDKYEKQTLFVTNLIQFAMKYNVCVILVVHPKKMEKSEEYLDLYDVSGSANLINLAHRSFALNRISPKMKKGELRKRGDGWLKEPIPYDVVINVIKDRMNGMNGTEFGLYYDKASRRFFTNPAEYDWQYNWDKTDYEYELPYPIVNQEGKIFGTISADEGIDAQ